MAAASSSPAELKYGKGGDFKLSLMIKYNVMSQSADRDVSRLFMWALYRYLRGEDDLAAFWLRRAAAACT